MRKHVKVKATIERETNLLYKLPLVLTPQAEGGYTIACPVLPELITEGDTLEATMSHLQDALTATLELYEDLGKPVPTSVIQRTQTPQSYLQK